jgi:small-conductance mechanosensitive channel
MKKLKFVLPIILVFLFLLPLLAQESVTKKTDSSVVTINHSITKNETKNNNLADTSISIVNQLKPPSVLEIISVGKVIWSIIFFVVGLYLIRLITKILEVFAERSASYRITIKGIVPIVRIFGWVLIIYIIIAGIFQPPVSTVIAVTASIGIAVGFAAQDILKNIFGGIMILFDRPFQVGDKIQLGDYYGEVIKIGLRSTKIVTADDSTVTIPNGELMNKSVSNSNYGEPNCQVVAEIYLPIDIDTDKVRQIAIEAAQVSKYVYLNKPIVVLFFNEIKDRRAYLKMRLKAYVMDIRYEFPFKSDMTEIVMKELLNRNVINAEDYN